MADFAFYCAKVEWEEVLQGVLYSGPYGLVSAKNYESPVFPRHSSVDSTVLKNLEVNKTVYVTGEFTGEVIPAIRLEKGSYAGTYQVDWVRDGHVLKLTLPGEKPLDGCVGYYPGYLGYQSYYFDHCGRAVAPSELLKQSYQCIVKQLKKYVRRAETYSQRIWVAPIARERGFDQNAKFLVNGLWVPLINKGIGRKNDFPPKNE